MSGSKPQDAYHRNLAFLWLPGGVFINERLVAEGDATFRRLEKPDKGEVSKAERFYAKRMKRDVIRAAMAKRGLWGACSPTED
jgi:endonuclease YncB( thermonuclease family)